MQASEIERDGPPGFKPRSKLARFMARVPLVVSFGILGATWIGFIFTITISEVLLRRRSYWHFAEQTIVFNALMGLTMLSLYIACSRSAGHPDPNIAPQGVHQPEGRAGLPQPRRLMTSTPHSRPATLHLSPPSPHPQSDQAAPPPGPDPDDIPLRFLRNSQWVTTRGAKDRPSPLPLPLRSVNRSLGTAPTATDGAPHELSPCPDSEGSGGILPAISPFPLALSPFVSNTATDAGDDSDWSDTSAEDTGTDSRLREHLTGGPHDRPPKGRGGYWINVDVDAEADSPSFDPSHRGESSRLLTSAERGHEVQALFAKSDTGGPRFCRKCQAWKPDRTHHCRFCQRCVLKMDHHCVWLSTCIGFHNYKPFLLFITYGTVLAIYTAAEAGYQVYQYLFSPEYYVPVGELTFELGPLIYMCIMFAGAFFALAVGSLAGYHWYLAINNLTTLEQISHTYPAALLPSFGTSDNSGQPISRGAWRPDHLLTRLERGRLRDEARDINVYDLGWRQNLRNIFLGPLAAASSRPPNGSRAERARMLGYAMWPLAPGYVGDGHSFEYDPAKLERLRELTRELRVDEGRARRPDSGAERMRSSGSEGDDEDDDGDDDEGYDGGV